MSEVPLYPSQDAPIHQKLHGAALSDAPGVEYGLHAKVPRSRSRVWNWVSEHGTRNCIRDRAPSRTEDFEFRVQGQLSSDLGTYKTAKAIA